MSVCAILCGAADDWSSIRLFVEHRRCWVINDIAEDSNVASKALDLINF